MTLGDPVNCSLPGSSANRIFQARILEWVSIPFSKGSSQPRDRTQFSCIGRQILHHLSHQGSSSNNASNKALFSRLKKRQFLWQVLFDLTSKYDLRISRVNIVSINIRGQVQTISGLKTNLTTSKQEVSLKMEKETAAHSRVLVWDSMDRGAWQAAVPGVSTSQTQLSNYTNTTTSNNFHILV